AKRHFFFFQAEDGIRAGHVTGVQTCALPILIPRTRNPKSRVWVTGARDQTHRGEQVGGQRRGPTGDHSAARPPPPRAVGRRGARSEERRGGKRGERGSGGGRENEGESEARQI